MIHELKILPEYFEPVIKGEKTFEIRVNDRDFKMGDYLALNEYWDGKYTGRSCMVYVDYILDDSFLLPVGMVAMSIKPCALIRTRDQNAEMIAAPPYWFTVPVIENTEVDNEICREER